MRFLGQRRGDAMAGGGEAMRIIPLTTTFSYFVGFHYRV
jgi:hypothetical protein